MKHYEGFGTSALRFVSALCCGSVYSLQRNQCNVFNVAIYNSDIPCDIPIFLLISPDTLETKLLTIALFVDWMSIDWKIACRKTLLVIVVNN